MDGIIMALQGGLASLASYLAAHVLLCLVPAFFIAGALSALVPQASITRFLGPDVARWKSYGAAAGAGSLLAVCSCTIQPLFAGIYRKGAGLGPAMTFLFFAPAANILALSYTGVALGAQFAGARLLLSLVFGIGIGMIMAAVFPQPDRACQQDAAAFAKGETPGRSTVLFLLTLLALLLAGTLKFDTLSLPLMQFDWHWAAAIPLQAQLDHWVPAALAVGAEGLSLHGVLLLALLSISGAVALRGLGRIDEHFGRLSLLALLLVALTLMVAALRVSPLTQGLRIIISARTGLVGGLLLMLAWQIRRLDRWAMQQWLWESWRFVRQIFPLLVVGVFAVGLVRVFIQPQWIQHLAGSNSLSANATAVIFGVFMYFPTLVEVPVASMFLTLGMHPGPLLAYLMADPELSLQSILITTAIIGARRTAAYVLLVAGFSILAGLSFGAWKDGASSLSTLISLSAIIVLLLVAVRSLARWRTT